MGMTLRYRYKKWKTKIKKMPRQALKSPALVPRHLTIYIYSGTHSLSHFDHTRTCIPNLIHVCSIHVYYYFF